MSTFKPRLIQAVQGSLEEETWRGLAVPDEGYLKLDDHVRETRTPGEAAFACEQRRCEQATGPPIFIRVGRLGVFDVTYGEILRVRHEMGIKVLPVCSLITGWKFLKASWDITRRFLPTYNNFVHPRSEVSGYMCAPGYATELLVGRLWTLDYMRACKVCRPAVPSSGFSSDTTS